MALNLTKLDPSTWQERLDLAIQDRQAIIACGMSTWERDDIMDTLTASIPKHSRVIILIDKNEPSRPALYHLPLISTH